MRLYCLVVWINSGSELHQLGIDANEELLGIFVCSYHKENPAPLGISGIVSKGVFNESAVEYPSLLPCNTAHSNRTSPMASVWPQWGQLVGGLCDKIWDLAGLMIPLCTLWLHGVHELWYEKGPLNAITLTLILFLKYSQTGFFVSTG